VRARLDALGLLDHRDVAKLAERHLGPLAETCNETARRNPCSLSSIPRTGDSTRSSGFTGTFGDDGDSIAGRWEKSPDGSNWETDFEVTYARVR
jgi:hypothetical protein